MDVLLLLMIIILVVLAGVIVFMIFEMFSYKHKVQIREVINGRRRIKNLRAKEVRLKDGGVFWRLKGEKIKDLRLLPVPPSECIDIDAKGKYYVVAYRSSTGDTVFAKDETQHFADVKQFKPLTSTQRVMLVNQFRKSADRRGKSWQDHLPMIVVGIQVLIIIVLIAVFMEDVAKPFIEAKELQVKQQELLLEQTKIMQEIQQGVQRIESETPKPKSDALGGVPN